jgi:hypothetical protein
MEFTKGNKFTHDGIEWTITEVYMGSNGYVHSFNAIAFTHYWMIQCFNVIENQGCRDHRVGDAA